jgi:hypothetical protein
MRCPHDPERRDLSCITRSYRTGPRDGRRRRRAAVGLARVRVRAERGLPSPRFRTRAGQDRMTPRPPQMGTVRGARRRPYRHRVRERHGPVRPQPPPGSSTLRGHCLRHREKEGEDLDSVAGWARKAALVRTYPAAAVGGGTPPTVPAVATPSPRRFGESQYAIEPKPMIDSTLITRSTRVIARASVGGTL